MIIVPRTCVGDIIPHSKCYEGCGCVSKGSRYILEEWIREVMENFPISSSRQLVTMLYNHGGVGQTVGGINTRIIVIRSLDGFGIIWRKKGVVVDD